MKKKLKDITIGEAEKICHNCQCGALYNCSSCPFYIKSPVTGMLACCYCKDIEDFDLDTTEIELGEE